MEQPRYTQAHFTDESEWHHQSIVIPGAQGTRACPAHRVGHPRFADFLPCAAQERLLDLRGNLLAIYPEFLYVLPRRL